MDLFVKYLTRVLLCIGLLFFSWAFLRIFVCDQFVVPTDSMSPTLIAGDRILVEKLTAGARIYKKLEFGQDLPLRVFRTPGFGEVRVNDVVVFNAPHGYDRNRLEFKINYVYAKRCIGTPGDTISIRNGYFYNSNFPGAIGDTVHQRRLFDMPDSLIARDVLRVQPLDDRNYGWTIRNMGPVRIPRSGDLLRLDSVNFRLYRFVVQYETGSELHCEDGVVKLGEKPISEYAVRNDYYYFCGDNVLDSKDCRYLGFVPEDFVIGIVRRITYSENPFTGERSSERRWKRVK